MESCEEVDGASVVSCCDVPVVLKLVEEAFDAIAQPVGDGIMRDEDLSRTEGGDDGGGADVGDEGAQGVVVVGLLPARSAAAVVLSWASPPVRIKRKGRPSASVRAWILVVNPPRERPRA